MNFKVWKYFVFFKIYFWKCFWFFKLFEKSLISKFVIFEFFKFVWEVLESSKFEILLKVFQIFKIVLRKFCFSKSEVLNVWIFQNCFEKFMISKFDFGIQNSLKNFWWFENIWKFKKVWLSSKFDFEKIFKFQILWTTINVIVVLFLKIVLIWF